MGYKNLEKRKASQMKYYWKHPFTRLAKAIKKKDKTSTVTAKQLWSLAKKQKNICKLTGEKLTNLNISPDHIIARCNGGASNISNIQLVTKQANQIKFIMSMENFLQICLQVVVFNKLK